MCQESGKCLMQIIFLKLNRLHFYTSILIWLKFQIASRAKVAMTIEFCLANAAADSLMEKTRKTWKLQNSWKLQRQQRKVEIFDWLAKFLDFEIGISLITFGTWNINCTKLIAGFLFFLHYGFLILKSGMVNFWIFTLISPYLISWAVRNVALIVL